MRDLIRVYLPIIGLVLVGFAVAFRFVDPAPPRHIRIATGVATGFYAASAQDRSRPWGKLEALQRQIRPLQIPPAHSESHDDRRLHANFVRQLLEGGAGRDADAASTAVRAGPGCAA